MAQNSSRPVDQLDSEDLTYSPDHVDDQVATPPPMTLRSSAGLPSDAKTSAASFSPREGVDSAVGGGESGKETVFGETGDGSCADQRLNTWWCSIAFC